MAGRLSAMDIAFRPAGSKPTASVRPPEAEAVSLVPVLLAQTVFQFLDQLGKPYLGRAIRSIPTIVRGILKASFPAFVGSSFCCGA